MHGGSILIAAGVVAAVCLVGARHVLLDAATAAETTDAAAPRDAGGDTLVLLSPPPNASARSLDAAVDRALAHLGARPRTVLDVRVVGDDGARARTELEPAAPRVVVGSVEGVETDAATFPVDAIAPHKRALESVVFPERVPSGRVFRATLRGESLDAANVRVSVDGAAASPAHAARRASGDLDVTLGPLAPGTHRFEVGASDREPPIRIACEAGAPPRVVALGDPQGLVARALAAQGYRVDAIAGDAIPDDAALVLASDASAIPAAAVRAALDRGCGLLVVGAHALARASSGELAAALPARAKHAPPIENPEPPKPDVPPGANDAPKKSPDPPKVDPPPSPPTDTPSPVRPKDPEPSKTPPNAPPPDVTPAPRKKETEAAKVALALLIDRSGSMQGPKLTLAKQAALACAQILAIDDYLTVVAFNNEPSVTVRLDIPGSSALLRQKLERIQASGGTDFYPALLTAREQLLQRPAAIRHIVLLTDGGANDRDTADFRGLLTRTFFGDGITVSTVFVTGEGDQDPNFLGLLAKWGRGRSYPVTQNDIPQIVAVEVRRVFGLPPDGTRRAVPSPNAEPDKKPKPPVEEPPKPKVDEPPKPEPPKPTPPKRPSATVVPEPGAVIVEGMDLAGLPPVESFVELEERAGAAVVLRASPQGSALMAARAVGAGAVAALGIDETDGLDRWEKDPRLLELLARTATAIESRAAHAPDAAPPFEAMVVDGEVLLRGADRLGLLPEIPRGAERASVGGRMEGATRLLDDGLRVSSIRANPDGEPRADVDRALARLRGPATSAESQAAARDAKSSAGGIPALATALLVGAAIAIAAGTAAARRG